MDIHQAAESQGRVARINGWDITKNPYLRMGYPETSNLVKSWNAGWVDIDEDKNVTKKEINKNERH